MSVLGDTAEVVTLDIATGEEIWRRRLSGHPGLGISIAPLVHDGSVFVATSAGGNSDFTYHPGASGSIYRLDLSDGSVVWEWRTTKDDLWGNPQLNSGGGVWYPPSVDDAGVLYFGTGNAAPFPGTEDFPNGSSRPGPNDYANSLVALDAGRGELLWHINVAPHDLFDHDNQQTPVLATLDIAGTPTNMVFSAGKDGYVVAAESETGAEVWRCAVEEHQNDHLTELPDTFVEVKPGLFGGVQSPMAYADGVLYVGVLNLSTEYNRVSYNLVGLDRARGELVALDAATGSILWRSEIASGLFGAGPTIVNDVVFVGAADGLLRGFRTSDGQLLWSMQFDAGLIAPFAVAGESLLVPAGGFLVPSIGSDRPADPAEAKFAVVSLTLGDDPRS